MSVFRSRPVPSATPPPFALALLSRFTSTNATTKQKRDIRGTQNATTRCDAPTKLSPTSRSLHDFTLIGPPTNTRTTLCLPTSLLSCSFLLLFFLVCQAAKDRAHKLPLLRRVCQRLGLRVLSRSYEFDTLEPVDLDDVVNVFPVVKVLRAHSLPTAKVSPRLHRTNGMCFGRSGGGTL